MKPLYPFAQLHVVVTKWPRVLRQSWVQPLIVPENHAQNTLNHQLVLQKLQKIVMDSSTTGVSSLAMMLRLIFGQLSEQNLLKMTSVSKGPLVR